MCKNVNRSQHMGQTNSPFLQRRMGVLVNVLKASVGYEAAQIIVFFVIICGVCAFGFGFGVYRDAVTKQYKIVSSGGGNWVF